MQSINIDENLQNFLEKVRKIKGAVLIISSPLLKNRIFDEIKKFYSDSRIRVIDSSITDKENIDKTFSGSLKEGSLLLVSLEKQTSPVVTRRLEQIFNDGYISINTGNNWLKIEPVDSWQVIAWGNQDSPHEDLKILENLFYQKLVVTS
jgi:hypothetical protein